ncbi:MAG: hypothetical protein ACRELD_16710, partial [Longimicrobiales bacterium]
MAPGGAIDPDDTDAAVAALRAERARVLGDAALAPARRATRLIELGAWADAERGLRATSPTPETRLASALLALKRHRYDEAARLVDGIDGDAAVLLRARLEVQAWRLAEAERIALSVWGEGGGGRGRTADEAGVLLGRVELLRQDFDAAERWAERLLARDADNADALLLLSDVRFWRVDPAGAEEPLRRSLALDPFDADARFNYGYAIWRRVDATQLDAMAAQWQLALAIDSLHYLTQWHWGNGHTQLTYADYAHPTDSIVRVRLAPVDSLIPAGRSAEAIARSREVEAEFPESVLPAMLRGSAFYMAWHMPARLDSAEATFRDVLARKTNYGPAHNGLAAVIKQRQVRVLAAFDSLEADIAATPLPDDSVFWQVFTDVGYYPGERVPKMVWNQLGPSRAYIPLLHRLERDFTIPPLHKDLAEAMDEAGFRVWTTFDNRQWMDIRGVGGGATGIEYVERGSHQERNVTAHEYVHLFHGNVLTDTEVRRIRELYYAAMEQGRALDYYAENNESEYFAQGYEAWLSPVKVHPLNHKSMNTRDDLARKDPPLHAFIDSLVARQNAFLAGDAAAFSGNWAQVYVGRARAQL